MNLVKKLFGRYLISRKDGIYIPEIRTRKEILQLRKEMNHVKNVIILCDFKEGKSRIKNTA